MGDRGRRQRQPSSRRRRSTSHRGRRQRRHVHQRPAGRRRAQLRTRRDALDGQPAPRQGDPHRADEPPAHRRGVQRVQPRQPARLHRRTCSRRVRQAHVGRRRARSGRARSSSGSGSICKAKATDEEHLRRSSRGSGCNSASVCASRGGARSSPSAGPSPEPGRESRPAPRRLPRAGARVASPLRGADRRGRRRVSRRHRAGAARSRRHRRRGVVVVKDGKVLYGQRLRLRRRREANAGRLADDALPARARCRSSSRGPP